VVQPGSKEIAAGIQEPVPFRKDKTAMAASALTTQSTAFTRDVLGRWICNTLEEARQSADPTKTRPDGRPQIEARDFDLIIIGGGTFGSILAEHLSFRDKARKQRILVLEAGPFVLSEHVQNLPILGLNVPKATNIAALRSQNAFGLDKPMEEVWGLPWHSPVNFPGLAFCLGGRSLYWGGWSPELMVEELPTPPWPAQTVADMTAAALPDGSSGYFKQASEQIGVVETNDFIFGDLHRALRSQLFKALNAGSVKDAVDFTAWPDAAGFRYAATPPTLDDMREMLGLPSGTAITAADARNQLKLEAPLAVQGQAGHAGFFPFNKFSAVPLLIKAAREAFSESGGDDARKRLMIVPQCHVKRLRLGNAGSEWRVETIETNQGAVPVPVGGKVVLALGALESARLVQASFAAAGAPVPSGVGKNLMAHLRSNLDIRVERSKIAGLPATAQALQASALFVKGRHTFAGSTDQATFHLQITASGLGAIGGNSEAELFKKIPDIDTFHVHQNASDSHVAITIRGIGEMQPNNPDSEVRPDPLDDDEFGVRRAFVALANPLDPAQRAANPKAARDFELWNAMDQAAKDVAKAFGVASPPDPVRDVLGTTHHETGTLAMGEVNSISVALPDCRLRALNNTYVAGPALFPTIGSPNPMLTGVALVRRLGDQLATSQPFVASDGFTVLFNGFDKSKWRMTTIRNQANSDSGSMRVIGGALETAAGNDMGIFWHTDPTPPNFILRLQWLRWSEEATSGVYLRFPDPESKGYNNTAYVADDFGFEVQIDERGDMPVHRTGAIYRKDNRTDGETLNQIAARPVGEWNDYEIHVKDQTFRVSLNGTEVCVFNNTMYPGRGAPSSNVAPSFIGLQVYPNSKSQVAFRHVRIQAI
jgi:choline dehydrogenase-like flavoprotein